MPSYTYGGLCTHDVPTYFTVLLHCCTSSTRFSLLFIAVKSPENMRTIVRAVVLTVDAVELNNTWYLAFNSDFHTLRPGSDEG